MFPRLTNIESNIASKIKNTSTLSYGKLNCFVRLISGTGDGLIMVSNPDWKLFEAAGARGGFTLYGGPDRSGTVGIDWKGKPVNTNDNTSGQIIDTPFKPTPIVTSINIKEGKDQISRHCDLKFTAFTLAQVELLQKYFMEPGHSLCVEYGWNTAEGYSGLVSVAQPNSLPAIIGERNLDYNSLHTTRVQTNGEYDSFFGFIVGGSVTSNGDAFDVSIKLRGAPGLPTYLQSQFNIKQQAADGTINNNDAEPPFDISELNLEAADQMAERRFKMLFNFLPKTRRTTEVKNLLFRTNDNIWTNLDFVNFDPVIDNQISIFRDGRPSPAVSGDGTLDNASTSGASGTDASSGTSSDKGSNAAAQSGQQKKTEDAKGKATRSDAPGLQWERLNNIANEYVKASGDENNAAWKAYVTTWKVTAAEISEVKSTRIEIQKINTSGQVVGTTGPVQVPFVAQGPVGQPNPLGGNLAATFNVYKVKAVPAPPIPDGTPGQVGEGGGFTVGIAEGAIGPTEIMLDGGIPLPKEKLFSKNRYIRFAKAVQILNANTSLKSLLIGGKIPVNVVIDIKEAKIGAFYGIYSCKPEALLIPGWMPNFSKFFMEANLQELSTDERLIDNSIGTISFAQKDALAKDGYVEDAYRWGLLEHLYINFDLFKRELEKPNQAMKDVLQTLLNEMSTAVNGFWNFQIAEKSTKLNGHNTTVYTVYDENWVGKYNSSAAPVEFIHSGERSKFLEANLNIEIPGSMMNKIITQRLALVSNPDQQEIALGGAFSSSRDRFFTKYLDTGEGSAATSGGSGTSGASGTSTTSTQLGGDNPSEFAKEFNKINQSPLSEEQKKLAADHDALLAKLKEQAESAKTSTDMINNRSYKNEELQALYEKRGEAQRNRALRFLTRFQPGGEAIYQAALLIEEQAEKAFNDKLAALELTKTTAENALKDAEAKSAELLEQFKAQGSTNVSNNLDVIDVVPNPAENTITQDDLVNFLTDINVFKQKFKVYCCRDQNFLNILKVNNINPKLKTIKTGKDDAGNPTVSIGGSLTPPLPIKYSFKIIGRSGIRRGDTFNIIGIPAKYKNHGFFQVTEIEHTIDNMKWVTRVQGEYRQLQ